ncbi:unnamed protein product [Microthlaspi erraticum]|uniref:F-box domain-containing protein n=1 Tax=Microthlaspi erraticum TaxID=1685480 RepID=A0A6D2JES0_9BRAS|nr:unnamed protein product [Microthlaspi erraticum]
MSRKSCLGMESPLPHHVVELIMEKLPAKSLLRFKAVSKQWRSTIESPSFPEKKLKHRQQSGDPDVLMACVRPNDLKDRDMQSLRIRVLGSSSLVKIPCKGNNMLYLACISSFDGLVCLHDTLKPAFVVNPTTRCHRTLPLSKLQQLRIDLDYNLSYGMYKIGFGKDKFTGTCKPVWLYNSSELGLENDTTCEVFDFTTSSWRYVTPAAPYRVIGNLDSVYVDGSLHWFTECKETKVVSFDLHTESFQVVSKAPFAIVRRFDVLMCATWTTACAYPR